MFYTYGMYSIEQFYNWFYIVYIAILALSFWSIVYGLVSINRDVLHSIRVTRRIRNISIGCLIFVPLMFYSLWIVELIPLMRDGDRIDYIYSIFILDMAFVFPAFILSLVLILKRNALGLLLAPILFIKTFTVLFSATLGGLVKQIADGGGDPLEIAFYFVFSLAFLALAVFYLRRISFEEIRNE
jgi:hypothetical protein